MRAIVSSAAAFAMILAGTPAASAQTAGTATPAPCARPNVPATTLRAVLPDTPAIAQQQAISGTVQIVVSLDAESHVTGARVQSSPSSVLNAPALAAARRSAFQTEIRDCKPIAADYIYSVDFETGSAARLVMTNAGVPTIVVTTQGVAQRPADVAVVMAYIVVRDDDAAAATSRSLAILDAFRTRLRSLGIGDDKIRATYALTNAPRPAVAPSPSPFSPVPIYGPYASRQVTVTVEPATQAATVLDAASAAGVTSVNGVRYELRDREAAYREAIANGIKDAQARAAVIASSTHMRLGPVQSVQNAGSANAFAYGTGPSYSPATVTRSFAPSPVEVRADVTVTYLLLKP